MAKIAIKAKPRGAERVARRFLTAAAQIPGDTLDAQRELGRKAEVIYAAHAPFRSGRLIRGITSSAGGGGVIVRADARNPESGFDYVRVTRFGHMVDRIFPKNRQFGAYNLATKKRRGYTAGKARLRFVIGGKVVYAASVAGYHPASDWAEDAFPEISAAADLVAARLGRKIEARF